jgi:Zn/Cd-binding protein ZinT
VQQDDLDWRLQLHGQGHSISESKSFHFHIYLLEEIINNPLDEVFQKPLLVDVI